MWCRSERILRLWRCLAEVKSGLRKRGVQIKLGILKDFKDHQERCSREGDLESGPERVYRIFFIFTFSCAWVEEIAQTSAALQNCLKVGMGYASSHPRLFLRPRG